MFEELYEDITDGEANFILDMYSEIQLMVYSNEPVTLVGLGNRLGVKPQELADHLPIIITILNKVEKELEIQ